MDFLDGLLALIPAVLSLGLLVWLAWRGLPVLVIAPLLAGFSALLAGDAVMATLTLRFMPALGGFVIAFFPLFMLGAIFGRLMEVSGAASTIAQAIIEAVGEQRAIVAIVAACAILTYGGISLFVVAFAVYPIARAVFRVSAIDHSLIPASIALGAFTFTMTALPGTPAIQNVIPMPYFGTTVFAAPVYGVLAALIMAVGGVLYLQRKATVMGVVGGHDFGHDDEAKAGGTDRNAWLSFLPILVVLAGNFVLSFWIYPNQDLSFLNSQTWGFTLPQSVIGTWSLIISLIAAIVTLTIIMRPHISNPMDTMGEGATMALVPLFNTAALVGFGAVIAGLPAFGMITDALDQLPGGLLVNLAVSTALLAGITGSASGGMSIALDVLGDKFVAMGQEQNVDPALMHRVVSLSTGSLDALPHNGAVITLLGIGKLTHQQAYGPMFVVAVLIPLFAAISVVALMLLFGSV